MLESLAAFGTFVGFKIRIISYTCVVVTTFWRFLKIRFASIISDPNSIEKKTICRWSRIIIIIKSKSPQKFPWKQLTAREPNRCRRSARTWSSKHLCQSQIQIATFRSAISETYNLQAWESEAGSFTSLNGLYENLYFGSPPPAVVQPNFE